MPLDPGADPEFFPGGGLTMANGEGALKQHRNAFTFLIEISASGGCGHGIGSARKGSIVWAPVRGSQMRHTSISLLLSASQFAHETPC